MEGPKLEGMEKMLPSFQNVSSSEKSEFNPPSI